MDFYERWYWVSGLINTIPRPKQVEAASFTTSRDEGLLSFATGTGKSYIAILTAIRLVKDQVVDKFIFVCTKSSYIEIRKDFEIHTNCEYVTLSNMSDLIGFLDGNESSFALIEYNTFEKMALVPDPESENDRKMILSEERIQQIIDILDKRNIGINIDEIHKLKNPSARITTFFRSIRPYFKKCYGYTATPIMKELFDVYHIINFLKPHYFGTYWEFSKRYMIRHQREYQGRKVWVTLRYKNLGSLNRRLKKVMLSHYPIRDVQFIPSIVKMHSDTFPDYQLAASGFFDKEGKEIEEAKGHAARMCDVQTVVNADLNKWEALKKMVSQKKFKEHGFLVYCSYYDGVEVVESVLKSAGIEYREISGRVTSKEKREERKEWFVEDSANKALILTRAGGESLNLQATPHIIFYDIPFGIGYFIQIMGRIVRDFSPFSKFFIYFMVIEDSIDQYKYQYINMHREDFDKVLRNEFTEDMNTRFSGFNAYILDNLRRDLIWSKGN